MATTKNKKDFIMSGGGGGYTPRPPEGGSCESTIFRTRLASPVPAVIATLSVGDTLGVVAAGRFGPLQCVNRVTGNVAGSINHGLVARMLKCIEDGYGFEAEVLSVTSGLCDVEVRPV